MKDIEWEARKKYFSAIMAVTEGLWNGVVISGVLAVSALLVNRFWIF
jgi:hypothetical protein